MINGNVDYGLLALGGAALWLAQRVYRVRKARFARVQAMEAKYAELLDNPEKMNYKQAADIMKLSHCWDLPWTTTLALTFALFKTYAIPTISSVLCKSSELSSSESAARRAEDTATIITDSLFGDIDGERGTKAIARMNWLHARYGSLVTQDDLRYVLSLFVYEPIYMNQRFEWRGLTELEKQARYVFWRELGARMEIKDIPNTAEALYDWAERYADKAFVYAPSNEQVGNATIGVLLRPMPDFVKPMARQAALVLLDDRTRNAFGWPAPPAYLYWLVPKLLALKGLVSGYLLFPRTSEPGFLRFHETVDEEGVTHVQREGFLFEPWYCAEGSSSIGLFGFGKPSSKWNSSGFVSELLGPERLKGQGRDIVIKKAEQMRERAAGCPFYM